jgi:hypothetical protein
LVERPVGRLEGHAMTEVERMAEDFLRAHCAYFAKGRWSDVRQAISPKLPADRRVIVAIIELND